MTLQMTILGVTQGHLKNEDNLQNEKSLQNEEDLKNEENLKNEDVLKQKKSGENIKNLVSGIGIGMNFGYWYGSSA